MPVSQRYEIYCFYLNIEKTSFSCNLRDYLCTKLSTYHIYDTAIKRKKISKGRNPPTRLNF